MAFKEILYFILRQLSAGSVLQNIGFYALMILLIGIVSTQFKSPIHKYHTN
jgi:hypothetical protein